MEQRSFAFLFVIVYSNRYLFPFVFCFSQEVYVQRVRAYFFFNTHQTYNIEVKFIRIIVFHLGLAVFK